MIGFIDLCSLSLPFLFLLYFFLVESDLGLLASDPCDNIFLLGSGSLAN